MLDTMGIDDQGLEHVELRESLKPLLERLPAAGEEHPDAALLQEHDAVEIAAEVGVCQMHVSRLLNKTLEHLRWSLEHQS